MCEAFELTEPELALLVEAARTLDLCEALARCVDEEGVMATDGSRPHPAVAELGRQRIVAARLIAALRIPTDDDGAVRAGSRTQRRLVRGVYQMGGPA